MKEKFILSRMSIQNISETGSTEYKFSFDTDGRYYSLFISFNFNSSKYLGELYINIKHYGCEDAYGLMDLPKMNNFTFKIKRTVNGEEYGINLSNLYKNITVNKARTLVMINFKTIDYECRKILEFIDSIYKKGYIGESIIELELSDGVIIDLSNKYTYLTPEEYEDFTMWWMTKGPGKNGFTEHLKSVKHVTFPVLREVTKENGIMIDGKNYYEEYF